MFYLSAELQLPKQFSICLTREQYSSDRERVHIVMFISGADILKKLLLKFVLTTNDSNPLQQSKALIVRH